MFGGGVLAAETSLGEAAAGFVAFSCVGCGIGGADGLGSSEGALAMAVAGGVGGGATAGAAVLLGEAGGV